MPQPAPAPVSTPPEKPMNTCVFAHARSGADAQEFYGPYPREPIVTAGSTTARAPTAPDTPEPCPADAVGQQGAIQAQPDLPRTPPRVASGAGRWAGCGPDDAWSLVRGPLQNGVWPAARMSEDMKLLYY